MVWKKSDGQVILNLMRKYKKIGGWVLGVICFFLLIPFAEGAKSHLTYLLCRQQKFVRTIRVEVNSGEKSGCKTLYTKGGVDREVSNGIYTQSCMNIVDNIRGNLEAASWKCRDINSKAKILTLDTMSSKSEINSSFEKEQ